MNRYSYDGPVMEFDKCIAHNWRSETMAVSASKARSNLIFQFKKQFNRAPNSRISLPGKITMVQ